MKKTLSLLLMAVVLVTSLGIAPAVYADDTDGDAQEADVRLQGAGRLTAEGDGIAMLAGRGIVRLSGNGILWVKDAAGDATIEVSGEGHKTEFPDGWIQYAGFRGSASLKGSRLRIIIAGVDVDLYARGRGRALLWGHGTYEINGKSGQWDTERLGTQVRLTPANVPLSQ